MATRGSRNNLLAGAFVLGSLVLGVAVVLILSDIGDLATPKRTYYVRFTLDEGAEGLRPGSLVKVGGLQVGSVTDTRLERRPGTDLPEAVLVTIRLRSDVHLYKDAVAQLNLPLLGSNSSINIPSPGTGQAGQLLQHGDVLEGQLAPPSFLAQAGYGPEQAEQVQSIIARADRIVASVEQQWDPRVRQMLDDVRTVTTDVRERWPGWRDRVSGILDNVKTASDSMASIRETVKSGVDEARAIIADNRPRIDSAIQNIEELSRKANTEGWEMVRDALDKGRGGMSDFADAADHVRTLIREESPQLRRLIANARLASDQLKLTSAEVRAAPWKLLSPPTGRKELENEALYDAARAYSTAVSDLRAATEALRSVQESGVADRATIDALVAEVQSAFDKYKEAERQFLQKLQR